MIWTRIAVSEMERALVFVRGRLDAVLPAGVHRLWTLSRDMEIELHSALASVLASEHTAALLRSNSPLVDENFHRLTVAEGRAAMVFADGVLTRILGPGDNALIWKTPRAVTIREFDMGAEPAIDASLLPALVRYHGSGAWVHFVTIGEQMAGLTYINGQLQTLLGPGRHAYWSAPGTARTEVVDLRRQVLEVNAQEILTKDKVTLRVNISAEYRVVDPVLAARSLRNFTETLYRLLQLAVRRTLGTRTLDELLLEKVDIDPSAAESIRKEMAAVGIEIGTMALKDVILPGEIREILNQVVTAEKRAQANLIHRREETAATRSLLNTARLMEESPILMRLKELETLEKLTEKVGSVSVTGGYDGLLEKLLTRSGK